MIQLVGGGVWLVLENNESCWHRGVMIVCVGSKFFSVYYFYSNVDFSWN